MPTATREELKANFETGDTPTQAQFHQWIDTMFDLAQQTQDVVDELQAQIEAQPVIIRASVKLWNANDFFLTATYTVLGYLKCTVTVDGEMTGPGGSGTGKFTVTLTFDDAFAANTFSVFTQVEPHSAANTAMITSITRSLNDVVIVFNSATPTNHTQRTLNILIIDNP